MLLPPFAITKTLPSATVTLLSLPPKPASQTRFRSVATADLAQRILIRLRSDVYDKLQRARREASTRPLSLVMRTFALFQQLVSLVSFGVLIAQFSLWALVLLALAGLPAFILPSPGQVFERFLRALGDGTLLANAWVTLQENNAIAIVDIAAEDVAPTITSNGGGAAATALVAENTTAVTTVTATDPNAGDAVTFSIVGGADAATFTINATTGAVTFASGATSGTFGVNPSLYADLPYKPLVDFKPGTETGTATWRPVAASDIAAAMVVLPMPLRWSPRSATSASPTAPSASPRRCRA